MVTEAELIAMKTNDWWALEAQRQKIQRFKQNAEEYAENSAVGQMDYDNAVNRAALLGERLTEIDHTMFDLENWLIDHNAPGWVAT